METGGILDHNINFLYNNISAFALLLVKSTDKLVVVKGHPYILHFNISNRDMYITKFSMTNLALYINLDTPEWIIGVVMVVNLPIKSINSANG